MGSVVEKEEQVVESFGDAAMATVKAGDKSAQQ